MSSCSRASRPDRIALVVVVALSSASALFTGWAIGIYALALAVPAGCGFGLLAWLITDTLKEEADVTLFGPDVSHNNAHLDVARAAAEGCSFLIGKVSQGATFRDPSWAGYRDDARAHGLLLVGYHMISSDPPAAQAANCKAAIGDPSIPLALDWERSGNSGGWSNFTTVLAAFRAAGLNVRLAYCPRWYWESVGSPDMSGAALPLWSSRYVATKGAPAAIYPAVTPAQWQGYGGLSVALVQFTDSAAIAGCTYDCSAFNGTRDQLAALLGGAASSAPAPHLEDDVSASVIPLPLRPDGSFRVAVPVEVGTQCSAGMWLSYTAAWSGGAVAITALDASGAPIGGAAVGTPALPKVLPLNVNQVYAVPAAARTVTFEGRGEIGATLLTKAPAA